MAVVPRALGGSKLPPARAGATPGRGELCSSDLIGVLAQTQGDHTRIFLTRWVPFTWPLVVPYCMSTHRWPSFYRRRWVIRQIELFLSGSSKT